MLAAATATLHHLGDTLTVQASVAGQTLARPTIALVSEQRWLGERSVLDSAAFARRQVVAHAPGRAVLSVGSYGARPAQLTVDVRPDTPLVLGLVPAFPRPTDTLRVRGYALDRVDVAGVTLGGERAMVLGRDSAEIRVAVPPALPDAGCDTGAPQVAVAVAGAVLPRPLTFPRARAGEWDLAPGEAARLSPQQASCLRLAGGREYVLAWFDTIRVHEARTGSEGAYNIPVDVTIADRTGASGGPAGVASVTEVAKGRVTDIVPRSAAGDSTLTCAEWAASAPWKVGDRINACGAVQPRLDAVVIATPPGLALAVAVTDTALLTPLLRTYVDTAIAVLETDGIPLLRHAVLDTAVTTNAATGQYLVLFRNAPPGSWAGMYNGREVQVNLAYQPHSSMEELQILSHELTHAWTAAYVQSRQIVGGFMWGVEGNADLISHEIVRRHVAIPLDANWIWGTWAGGPARPYADVAGQASGDLPGGYFAAESFLRDLLLRMIVDKDVPYETALRAVVRGAAEGWFAAGRTPGEGLTDRMRALLDPAWDPAGAVLLWTMSQALDDQTPSPLYQNPSFYCAACPAVPSDPGNVAGWKPDLVITPGSGVPTYALNRQTGEAGYMVVEDRVGGTLGLPADRLVWLVARRR